MTAPHVTFILNPAAGRGKALHIRRRLEEVLRRSSLDYTFLVTAGPGDATVKAREAAAGSSVVVAVGGDGTVNETAAGVMGTGAALAVLSEGSGNDFARTIGAPSRPEAIVERLHRYAVGHYDVGRAVLTHADGRTDERWFFNSIGIGFDAAVARRVSAIRRLRGIPLYLTALVQTIAGFAPRRGTITAPGVNRSEEFLVVCAGLGKWEGGGFKLTPDAVPDDGLFQICCAVGSSMREVVPVLPFTLTGRHIGRKHIVDLVTDRFTLALEGGFPVHGDGESFGTDVTTVEVSLVPGALKVVLPPGR